MIDPEKLEWSKFDPKEHSSLQDGWYFWRRTNRQDDPFYWETFFCADGETWVAGIVQEVDNAGYCARFMEVRPA